MPETKPLISIAGKTAVLTPSADLTAASVPDLRIELKGLVADGARDVVLDLSEVSLVDSTGIGLMVAIHNSLLRLDGKLRVVHVSENLVELFRAFRLDKHFSVNGK
jgi:anti-anti-sigma factor